MQRRDLNAPDTPPPVAAYTNAIEVSGATRTLYISGQVGQRMDGTIPDDIVEQSRLAWQNLEAQVKAAGMTLDNLVKVTTILPNHGDVAAAREALGDRKPASKLREFRRHSRDFGPRPCPTPYWKSFRARINASASASTSAKVL